MNEAVLKPNKISKFFEAAQDAVFGCDHDLFDDEFSLQNLNPLHYFWLAVEREDLALAFTGVMVTSLWTLTAFGAVVIKDNFDVLGADKKVAASIPWHEGESAPLPVQINNLSLNGTEHIVLRDWKQAGDKAAMQHCRAIYETRQEGFKRDPEIPLDAQMRRVSMDCRL